MKIHLGGCVAGLKSNPSLYKKIRKVIIDLGHQITRDWIIDELKGVHLSQEKMYELTFAAIKKSDLVILEASEDTAGLGQQLLMALENKTPILILENEKKNKSIVGDFVSREQKKYILKKNYKSSNLKMEISSFITSMEGKAKYARFNLVLEKNLDNYLRDKAKKNKTSKTEEIKRLILEDKNKVEI